MNKRRWQNFVYLKMNDVDRTKLFLHCRSAAAAVSIRKRWNEICSNCNTKRKTSWSPIAQQRVAKSRQICSVRQHELATKRNIKKISLCL